MEHVYSIGEQPDEVPAYAVSYLRMQCTRRLILVCTICPCPINTTCLNGLSACEHGFCSQSVPLQCAAVDARTGKTLC